MEPPILTSCRWQLQNDSVPFGSEPTVPFGSPSKKRISRSFQGSLGVKPLNPGDFLKFFSSSGNRMEPNERNEPNGTEWNHEHQAPPHSGTDCRLGAIFKNSAINEIQLGVLPPDDEALPWRKPSYVEMLLPQLGQPKW
jgi:hypothetical protein